MYKVNLIKYWCTDKSVLYQMSEGIRCGSFRHNSSLMKDKINKLGKSEDKIICNLFLTTIKAT